MSAHADIDIKIGGQTAADLGIKLGRLTLTEAMNEHSTFSLECLALDEGSATALSGSQAKLDDLFKQLGKDFEITALSPDRNSIRHSLQFVGLVTDVRAGRQRGGGYVVHLDGKSQTMLMDMENHYRYGPQDDDARHLKTFLSAITSEYGSLCAVQISADPLTDYGMQFQETDFNFVKRIAQREKLWCIYDGVKFHITDQLPEGELELTMGPNTQENSLDTFSISAGIRVGSIGVATIDWKSAHQMASMTDRQTLPASLHPWAQNAKTVYDAKKLHVQAEFAERHIASQSELDAYLTARKQSWASNLVHAEGTSSNADVRVGRKLNLTGLGTGQASKYIVRSVTHQMDTFRGVYENSFEAFPEEGAAPRWDNHRPQAHEVFQAVVMEQGDDDHMGMVKVLMPGAGPVGTMWARVIQPFAGLAGGGYIVPEVDDEVIVAFMDGDPSRPVVLGSVYSGAAAGKAKSWEDVKNNAKNTRKILRTRSGHKIIFEDSETEGSTDGDIFIETGNGRNKMKLTGKGGSNTVEIFSGGSIVLGCNDNITLECGGDIRMQAKNITMKTEEDISMDVDGKVDVKSKGNISMDAKGTGTFSSDGDMNVSSATGGATLDGKTGATVSSSMDVKVSGMVSTKLDGAAGAASIELANGMITETAPMIKLN